VIDPINTQRTRDVSHLDSATQTGETFDFAKTIEQCTRAELEAMQSAGERIANCYRLLQKHEEYGNVVREVLKDQGTFYEFEHYPSGDVQDTETYGQYFYHAHRGINDENGHFHTFLRAGGMPGGVKPIEYQGEAEWPLGSEALSHLIAISMDKRGYPIGLFTTNRWVTGEAWYRAEDVLTMLDHFDMDLLYPSWPVNIWISAMMQLFKPQIEYLLLERDAAINQWQANKPQVDVYEDRDLEVTSQLLVDVDAQVKAINQALA